MTLAGRIVNALRPNERVQIESISDLSLATAVAGSYLAQPIQQVQLPQGGFNTTLHHGDFAQSTSSQFVAHVSRMVSSPIIGSLIEKRYTTLSMMEFTYQQKNAKGVYSETSKPGNRLSLLETPWPGGTTQELLATTMIDVDCAGNSYWTRLDILTAAARTQNIKHRLPIIGAPDQLVRLPPDAMFVILDEVVHGVKHLLGYAYATDGAFSPEDMLLLTPDEVAHIKPLPDPNAPWMGMSWITKVVREANLDDMLTVHIQKFLRNGATPNMLVTYPREVPPEQVEKFAEFFNKSYTGPDNAGRPIQMGGGIDVTVVGATLQGLEFGDTRGVIELRMASAAGVPPIVVGFSEGLRNGSYTDYRQARSSFADGTCHPIWQSIVGSFQTLFPPPRLNQRLWYDTSNNPYLRDDESQVAEIFQVNAATINTLIMAGFTPDSIVKAVLSRDMSLLEHSGLFSVQLQAAGTELSADRPTDFVDPTDTPSTLDTDALTGGPQ